VSEELTEYDARLTQDLKFIKIIDTLSDLSILDAKTSSLILFEIFSQIKKDPPFASQSEANARLKLLLFALNHFEIRNASNRHFIETLTTTLKDKIYEDEKFDEHLSFGEYLLLRDITERLIVIRGDSDQSLQLQINYLERKVFNY
jgi:hypothetical protein